MIAVRRAVAEVEQAREQARAAVREALPGPWVNVDAIADFIIARDDSLSAEIARLPALYWRADERRTADRRRRDAVLFGGVERRVEERRER